MDLVDDSPIFNINDETLDEPNSILASESVVENESCRLEGELELSQLTKPHKGTKYYFKDSPQRSRRVCNFCEQSYSFNTSTTNLKRHLKMSHPEALLHDSKFIGPISPCRNGEPRKIPTTFFRPIDKRNKSYPLAASGSQYVPLPYNVDQLEFPLCPSTSGLQTSQHKDEMGELKTQLGTLQAAMGTVMAALLKKDSGPDLQHSMASLHDLAPEQNYDKALNLMMLRSKGLKEILEDPAIASRTSSEAQFLTNLIQNLDDDLRLVQEISERARLVIAAHYYGWPSLKDTHCAFADLYQLGNVEELKNNSFHPNGEMNGVPPRWGYRKRATNGTGSS